jgi:hypothetical protein
MRHRIVMLLLLASQGCILVPAGNAAELDLESGGGGVPVGAVQRVELAASLESYFRDCHPYGQVVSGEELPQERLNSLWAEQTRLPHAVLKIGPDPDAPPQAPGPQLEVLFGFGSESGPQPVLARGADGTVTSYIKCPGLPGLLLSCRVHGLMPGMKPSPRCGEWAALDADISASQGKP